VNIPGEAGKQQEERARMAHRHFGAESPQLTEMVNVKKRVFLRCHFYIKTIILPRPARDKQTYLGKPQKKRLRFLTGDGLSKLYELGGGPAVDGGAHSRRR
jgi:hypothetical protein